MSYFDKKLFLFTYSFTVLLSELLCYKNWEICRDFLYHILYQLLSLSQTETKRKGPFLAFKIQNPFIPKCISMKLIHQILIHC